MGTEYSFASGAGIFEGTPKEAPGAKFREQVEMGLYEGSQADLKRILSELSDDFGPADYNLIRKNCNSFANALCWRLVGKKIPGHVNRLAELGQCCSCLLPRKMLENAPVGDPNQEEGKSSFLVKAGSRSYQTKSTTPVFAGQGARLGSSETQQQQAGSGLMMGLLGSKQKSAPVDDLTDRREKARKAAIARMEKAERESTKQS